MTEPKHAYAKFTARTDENGNDIVPDYRESVTVHFNPETLDITFTNTLQKGRRSQPAQIVNETTAKLSMELIFDTTLSGMDVRVETHKIAKMMDPAQQTPRRRNADSVKIPSIVIFQWGTINFEGYIDNYKERIEFFSTEGVPLRAVVTLSLTQQQRSFTPPSPGKNKQQNNGQSSNITPQSDTMVKRLGQNENVSEAAENLGDSSAARDLAQQNGIENLRHPEVDEIAVVNNLGRQAPALSSPTGMEEGPGTSSPLSETESSFADLRNQIPPSANLTPRVNLSLSAESELGQSLSLGGNAGFGLGGEAEAEVNASLSADVGVDADIELGIQFEE